MEGSIVEITELQWKLGRFPEIPKGSVETAYIFFQSKDNSKYVITTEKKKIMTAEVRSGKYDRIMKISRGHFTQNVKKEIPCAESGRYFLAEISFDYYIKDPEYIYKNSVYQIGSVLERAMKDMESDLGNSYSYQDRFRAKQAVQEWISGKAKKLTFLELEYSLNLDVDEVAKALIQRSDQHEIRMQEQDLGAIEEKGNIENKSDLEQLRLEKEKETEYLRSEISKMKIQQTGEILKQFGINGGNLISLANGEITGAELSKKMEESRRRERQDMLNMLQLLYEKGLVTEEIIENTAQSLLNIPKLDGEELGKLGDGAGEPDAKEDEPETGSFRWKDTKGESDTIE